MMSALLPCIGHLLVIDRRARWGIRDKTHDTLPGSSKFDSHFFSFTFRGGAKDRKIFIITKSGEVVVLYGDTYSKSMDQPGKVANPARGQLNREN